MQATLYSMTLMRVIHAQTKQGGDADGRSQAQYDKLAHTPCV